MSSNRWQNAWFPVAFLRDLDRDRPTPFTLVGQDLVLWFDRHASAWRAFSDVCPLSLIHISEPTRH